MDVRPSGRKGKRGSFSDLLGLEIDSGRVTFDSANSKGIQESQLHLTLLPPARLFQT
jgi:hypothetical protein